jgi:hypothetical protein
LELRSKQHLKKIDFFYLNLIFLYFWIVLI